MLQIAMPPGEQSEGQWTCTKLKFRHNVSEICKHRDILTEEQTYRHSSQYFTPSCGWSNNSRQK